VGNAARDNNEEEEIILTAVHDLKYICEIIN